MIDASFQVRPFAFDRVFAMPAVAATAPRPEDLQYRIDTLEAEMAQLRAENEALVTLARADGFEAGLNQARGEQQAALLAAVDALQCSIELTDERIEEITATVTGEAAEVALAAADVLAGRALEQAPGLAIDEAIGRVLKQVARGQDIVVRVHPALGEELQRLIAERQSGDRRQLNLHVARDATLAYGDARIEWDQGGLTLDAAERAAAVRAELETLLVPATPPADASAGEGSAAEDVA
ncbi:flagellar assembly protein FliH [Sphingomonas sp. ac-8]|uniref:flagellar assembly protein FliH n=1 Tax=Sphingomonas sp. ac-8 TaxID=3242977 RepID=UPI003A807C77